MDKEAFIAGYVKGAFGALIRRGILDRSVMEKNAARISSGVLNNIQRNIGAVFGKGNVPEDIMGSIAKMDAKDPIKNIGRSDLLMSVPESAIAGRLEMLPHIGKVLSNPQDRLNLEQAIRSMRSTNPNLTIREAMEDSLVKRMLDDDVIKGKPLDQLMDFENVLYKRPQDTARGTLPGFKNPMSAPIKFYQPDPTGRTGLSPQDLAGKGDIFRSGPPVWSGMPQSYVTKNPFVASHHAGIDPSLLSPAQLAARKAREAGGHGIGWNETDMKPSMNRLMEVLEDLGWDSDWKYL